MDKKTTERRWIPQEEKTLIHSPVMDILRQRCTASEDGREHTFYLFRSRDWCNIIPVTEDGKIVLVRQHRIGIDAPTMEMPGGVADESDQNPQTAALRELTEETGYVPLPGARCIPLGWTFPNPAIQNNRCHSFIVGPVRKHENQHLDDGEMIDCLEVPISELPERIANGEIRHALMLNAFLFLLLTDRGSRERLAGLLAEFTSQ